MATCKKIEAELERMIDFRIGDGASEKHRLVFEKKPSLSPLAGPVIFTEGEKIHLPAQFNLARADSDNETMIASAVRHESDHIKEFIELHKELYAPEPYEAKSINRFLENFFLKHQFRENPTLAHEIFNIVEDNRIDHKAREELPGLARFSREKEKPIYLHRRPSPKYLMKKGKELDAFRELFLQKTLLEETVDGTVPKYENLLNECVNIARDAEDKDIHASLEATEKIYAKFKENFDIKQPIHQLPSFASRDHDKLSPGLPRKYRGYIKPREGREENKKEQEKEEKERQDSDIIKKEQKAQQKKEKQQKEVGKESLEKEEKERREDRNKDKGKDKEKKESSREELEKRTPKEDKLSYWRGTGPFPRIIPKPSRGVNLSRPESSESDIEKAHKIINEYNGEIRAIESYFKRLEERYRGKKKARRGEEINIREYIQVELEHEATGVRPAKKIFRKRTSSRKKAAWAMLADISSSTLFGFGYQIIDYIKDALLIQGEALNYSGYPFGIFAFHSGGVSFKEIMNYRDTVHIIKDFKEDYTEESRGRIMSLYPYGGTLMVNAIEYIAANLKKVEGIPKGLSIITDGEPDTPQTVRDVLKKLQEEGILPFLFVIGSEHERCAKFLIDDYVIIKRDKLAELPNEVLRIFTTYGIMK